MKRSVFFTFVLFAMLSLALSCTGEMTGDGLDSRDSIQSQTVRQEIEITATAADNLPDTKTARIDKKFYWSPGDAISLFYGPGDNGGSMFVSTNTEYVDRTTFRGSIDVITGLMEGSDDIKFWGIFPYDQNSSCVDEGAAIITTIQHAQETAYNSWGQTQSICIGRSNGLAMGFYNLCGGIIFCISQEGINRVTFRGNNDEAIAGQVKVAMDGNNHPAITQFLGNEKEITVTAPGDFTPINGQDTTWYYLMLPPKTFSSGFTFTLYNDNGQYAENVTTKSRTVNRNVFGVMRTPLDKGLTFNDNTPQNNQIIYYASEEITDNTFLNGGTTQFANGRGVVTFTEDVAEIPAAAFANNTQLHRIILPESVTIIRDNAFKSCTNLTSVTVGSDATMGSSITEIENNAFFGCSSLADVVLPSVLTKLGAMAFGECTGLEGEMNIPSSVTTLAANPFYKCTGITAFTGKYASSDGLFLGSETTLVSAALGAPALAEGQSCNIPSLIQIISYDALAGLQASSVSMGPMVKRLGDECFKDAANLSGQIRIPETVEMIYSNVFQGCTSLSSVLFSSDNLPEIDINAFGGGSGDEETNFMVQISGYSTIESADMLGTSGNYWNDYRIAGRIQVVQDYDEIWFHNNDNSNFSLEQGLDFGSEDSPATVITSTQTFKPKFFINDIRPYVLQLPFTIDDNTSICVQKVSDIIYKVPDNAFKERTTLDYVSIQKAEIIGDYAFEKTGLVYFPIANAYTRYLQSIGDYAFSECTDLVFGTANYFNLTSVTSLGEGAFNLCEAFGSTTEGFASRLHLGQVTEIPSYAFNGCKKLTQILINNSGSQSADAVNSITSIGREAFSGCENLAGIDSKANNSTRINLPGVTSVGNKAFANCASIDTVSLPVAISLGTSAFENCTILASISIPLVENLGSNCFKGQHKLTQLNLLAVKTIGSGALGNGTKSIEIGISQSVQSLTNSLFSPMELSQTLPRSVVLLMAKSDPPAISDDTFSNLNVRTGGEFKIRLRNETIRDSYLRAWKGYFPFKNLSSSDLELIFVYQ